MTSSPNSVSDTYTFAIKSVFKNSRTINSIIKKALIDAFKVAVLIQDISGIKATLHSRAHLNKYFKQSFFVY